MPEIPYGIPTRSLRLHQLHIYPQLTAHPDPTLYKPSITLTLHSAQILQQNPACLFHRTVPAVQIYSQTGRPHPNKEEDTGSGLIEDQPIGEHAANR